MQSARWRYQTRRSRDGRPRPCSEDVTHMKRPDGDRGSMLRFQGSVRWIVQGQSARAWACRIRGLVSGFPYGDRARSERSRAIAWRRKEMRLIPDASEDGGRVERGPVARSTPVARAPRPSGDCSTNERDRLRSSAGALGDVPQFLTGINPIRVTANRDTGHLDTATVKGGGCTALCLDQIAGDKARYLQLWYLHFLPYGGFSKSQRARGVQQKYAV